MLATLEARQAAGSAQRLEGKQRRLMVTLACCCWWVGWSVMYLMMWKIYWYQRQTVLSTQPSDLLVERPGPHFGETTVDLFGGWDAAIKWVVVTKIAFIVLLNLNNCSSFSHFHRQEQNWWNIELNSTHEWVLVSIICTPSGDLNGIDDTSGLKREWQSFEKWSLVWFEITRSWCRVCADMERHREEDCIRNQTWISTALHSPESFWGDLSEESKGFCLNQHITH